MNKGLVLALLSPATGGQAQITANSAVDFRVQTATCAGCAPGACPGGLRFINDNAFFLLKVNAEFIISKLPAKPKDKEEELEAEDESDDHD